MMGETALRATLTRYALYSQRVDAMLTVASRLYDGVTDLLSDVDASVMPHAREDSNTQGYEGFESFMPPCVVVDWELHGDGPDGTPVTLAVRLATSFDDVDGETSILAHQSQTMNSLTLSIFIELCPDLVASDVDDVVDTALARVVAYRDDFDALVNPS